VIFLAWIGFIVPSCVSDSQNDQEEPEDLMNEAQNNPNEGYLSKNGEIESQGSLDNEEAADPDEFSQEISETSIQGNVQDQSNLANAAPLNNPALNIKPNNNASFNTIPHAAPQSITEDPSLRVVRFVMADNTQ